MSNEIKIQKNTAILLVVLFLAIVCGGYIAFTATSNTQCTGAWCPASSADSATQVAPSQITTSGGSNVQKVYLRATGSGYDKREIDVKKGTPVELHFSADANAGCGRALILDGFNVQLVSQNGEDQVAEFTPAQAGTYAYHCGMNMYRGEMVVQ